MTSKTSLALAAAAMLTLGQLSFAQQTDPNAGATGAAAATGASGQPSAAQASGGEQQMTQQLQKIAQDPKTACDKLFILEAAKCNMMEQSIAQQVAQKAQNDQVKQLAQRIVQDHAQAQQQLQQAAQQLDLQLPQQASPMEQQVIQIIASVPADQFDKQFVAHMQANHARDILLYQTEAQLGQSDPAKQYASQTLPTLQKHQQQTQQVAQALGLPSGSEAVPAGARIGADNSTSSGRSDSAGTQNQNTSGGTSGTGQSTSPGGTSGTAGSGATR